jgi:hypothetical protein
VLLSRLRFVQNPRKFALESASAKMAGFEEHLRVFSTVRRVPSAAAMVAMAFTMVLQRAQLLL